MPIPAKSTNESWNDGPIAEFFTKEAEQYVAVSPHKWDVFVFPHFLGGGRSHTVQLERCKLDSLEPICPLLWCCFTLQKEGPNSIQNKGHMSSQVGFFKKKHSIPMTSPLLMLLFPIPKPSHPKSPPLKRKRIYRKPNAWFHLTFQDFKSKSCCSQTNTILVSRNGKVEDLVIR